MKNLKNEGCEEELEYIRLIQKCIKINELEERNEKKKTKTGTD